MHLIIKQVCTPAYYTCKVLQMLSCLGLALAILITANLLWLQMLNATFLAFVLTQIAFIGHDAGHRQIFQSSRKTAAFGLLCTLLTAISFSWWTEKHTQHHSHPRDQRRPGLWRNLALSPARQRAVAACGQWPPAEESRGSARTGGWTVTSADLAREAQDETALLGPYDTSLRAGL